MLGKLFLIFLFFCNTALARDAAENIEMGLTVVPYVTALDNDRPMKQVVKTFGAHLVSTGSYLLAPNRIEPWTMSVATSTALICKFEGTEMCVAGALAASYVIYKKAEGSTSTIITGGIIGTASGSFIPAIIANF